MTETTNDAAERRKRLKAHHAECERVRVLRMQLEQQAREKWRAAVNASLMQGKLRIPSFRVTLPDYPPFPADLRDLTCGARTRAGTPCKQRGIFSNGRCKLHGGASTGPRTAEGKQRAARNGNAPKRKRTP